MDDVAHGVLEAWNPLGMHPRADQTASESSADLERSLTGLRPVLVRVAYRLVWDRHEAEDIAQEAVVRLLARAGPSLDETATRTWLLRATVRCAMERQRKRRRWRDRFARLREAPGPPAPPECAELADDLERLREHLLALPEKRQAALLLRDVEGCSYAEIGAVLGVAEATARVHVWAAREQLRRLMNPKENE